MSVSKSVRMALTKGDKRQTDLAKEMGFYPQTINRKMAEERWTGAELARIAAFTGGQLAFIYPDGQQILIEPPEEEKALEEK